MPKVIIPQDRDKLQSQITALEYLIRIDSNEKDLAIHKAALARLMEAQLREVGRE